MQTALIRMKNLKRDDKNLMSLLPEDLKAQVLDKISKKKVAEAQRGGSADRREQQCGDQEPVDHIEGIP